jgi:hypothetical protein
MTYPSGGTNAQLLSASSMPAAGAGGAGLESSGQQAQTSVADHLDGIVQLNGMWQDNAPLSGKISYRSGNAYEGPMDAALRPHGIGVMWGEEIYYGAWEHGEKHGHGESVDTTEYYMGVFAHNRRDGPGHLKIGKYERAPRTGTIDRAIMMRICREGTVDLEYEGAFRGGMMHGKGKMKWANGDVFDGEFKQGKRTWGKMRYANGSIYQGEFQ